MKVTLVNGSPRSRGATARVMGEIADYLARGHGAEIDYVDLASTQMRLCRGCIGCYRTGSCSLDDGLEAIVQRLRESDAVVIGSPTHGSNVSALLKNFIDRGHFLMERALLGKYAFSVATEEIADGGRVLRILDKFFLVAGAHRSGRFLVKLDFDGDPFARPRVKDLLHRKLERFSRAVRTRAKPSFFERLFGWLLVRFIWRPVLLRDPEKYAGILKQWRARGLLSSPMALGRP